MLSLIVKSQQAIIELIIPQHKILFGLDNKIYFKSNLPTIIIIKKYKKLEIIIDYKIKLKNNNK